MVPVLELSWGLRLRDTGRLISTLLLLLVVWGAGLEGAFDNRIRSVNSWAAAGAVDLFDISVLDVYRHPALAVPCRLQVDLSLTRLYNLPDFTQAGGVVAANCGRLTMAVGSSQLTGSDFYWERSYLTALSVGVHKSWRVGLAASYRLVQFADGYRRLDLVSPALGMMLELDTDTRLAVSVANLNRPRFFAGSQPSPLSSELSLAYRFSSRVRVLVHYLIDEKVPDRLSLAQRLVCAEELSIGFGVRTDPLEVSGGLSLRVAKFSFDYAYTDNVYLGGTHRIGLRYWY
jgi:hypothetical protein